ncbi:MAG: NAD(P)H-dependent oxidoreductase [Anaerohalosphaera sp.]|nr:NAD(P)H-dependent oxidoreductase [Anaerohalosphaera sp.]
MHIIAKLLYIQASPRGERSKSSQVAQSFLESYKEACPDDETIVLNIFDEDLPSFDGFTVQAKYNIMHGEEHSEQDRAAWRAVEAIIEEFKAADKYVLSIPMWNFGIPYRLKHYIDILVQPTYTFSVTDQGAYEGLVTGKPMFIACSRGGAYSPGTGAEAFDHQSPYLRTILGMIGFTDPSILFVEPTLAAGPEAAKKAREDALAHAREMAKSF